MTPGHFRDIAALAALTGIMAIVSAALAVLTAAIWAMTACWRRLLCRRPETGE